MVFFYNANLKLMRILYILFFITLTPLLFSQTELKKSVIGSGGNETTDGKNVIQSTIGQSVIGITAENGQQKGLGFWYDVNSTIIDSLTTAVVTLPTVESEIGQDITIPLLLVNSRQLAGKSHKWTATIGFNSTILYPLDNALDCGTNISCKINIRGEFSDSIGVLYNLKFRTKLGAVISTDLVIEDFKWEENISTIKKDGLFQLTGVCEINGEYRLIERSVKAGLYTTYPNPTVNELNLEYQLREDGINRMELFDISGKLMTTIFDLPNQSGIYKKSIKVSDMPSGSYYLVLTTPNEIFTKRISISK